MIRTTSVIASIINYLLYTEIYWRYVNTKTTAANVMTRLHELRKHIYLEAHTHMNS